MDNSERLELLEMLDAAIEAGDNKTAVRVKRILTASPKPALRGNAGDSIMNSLTFGFKDELGGIGASLGRKAFEAVTGNPPVVPPAVAAERETVEQRKDLAAFRERNPWGSAAIEVGAGLGPGITLGKGLAAGGRNLLARIAPNASQTTAKIGTNAAAGIAEGALAGYGEAGAEGAGLGALLGGGGATILPALGAGLARTGGALNQHVIRPVMDRISREPTTAAGRVLREVIDPDEARRLKLEMGPEATLADVGGDRALGLSQALATESPEGLARMRGLARSRREGQSARLRADMANATGNQRDYLSTLDEINARQKAAANQNYNEVYALDIMPDEEILAIMNRPAIRKSIRGALEDAANEGRELPTLDRIVMQGDDFRFSKENLPDMEALDHIKRRLDKQVSAAYRNGDPGADSLRKARDALRDRLDYVTGGKYREARDVFAGDAALKDAMESGERFLTAKTREVTEAVRGLSESEKEAYIVGAVEAIREKMGRAVSGQKRQFSFLTEDNVKQKLGLLFDRQQVNKLLSAMKREASFLETENLTINNAQTAMRASGAKSLRGDLAIPGTAEALENPMSAAFGAAMQKGRQALQGQSQASLGLLGDVMFNTDIDPGLALLQQQGLPPIDYAEWLKRMQTGMFGVIPGGVGVATQQ